MYRIYWTHRNIAEGMFTDSLTTALRICEEKRQAGYTFVSMVSENPDVVGKSGVDGIINGKLPDGEEYTWRKRR